ncbi:hypothetical protein ANCDUO_14776 [Ancylostoma duodenale]|uniref:Uncharacterized protein n=1 Tax=Ancylostoma duodenale TaxID=51022 RepID=A0A0C2GDB4_9BILA|nr:hypothetical protein ANCDUO_14776 [Ancylostoma duodenale]
MYMYEQDIIGTVMEPSKNDYKKICSIYNCEYCMGKKMSALDDHSTEELPQPLSVTTPAPFTQAPEWCYDQDPFQCLILNKRGDLDCTFGSNLRQFCCATCKNNGMKTTTVPTTTEEVVLPSTPPQEWCYDQDPFQCLILNKRGDLDCTFGSSLHQFCCATCRNNDIQTTTVPTTTEEVVIPSTPPQGCLDENPFMCKKMKEINALDCSVSSNAESCCQTCNANEEHFIYEEEPTTSSQPVESTTPYCYDENPLRCKRLARANELNCRSRTVRRKCCRTCKAYQDYFDITR